MNTRGIDYTTLTLKDALDLAVLIEEEARDRYEELAGQLEAHHTPEAAKFFRFMANNEEKHRAELAARRAALFGDALSVMRREMLYDIEAPDYDEARTYMTPAEALETAFRSEEKAYAFFDGVLPHITDDEVRALFSELREEELEHQALVKAELAKVPEGDGFAIEDFEDEPVAH